MKYLITGGAGFIGSHIVDCVLKNGDRVVVYDNFSTGKELFVAHNLSNKNFKLTEGDVLDTKKLTSAMKGADFVFHMAGHADVRGGFDDHSVDHIQNLEATQSVLEAMQKTGVTKIAFPSTSSVYGDATVHPTPEDYPFEPTSLYGATKAAAENYIRAYASYYDWQAYIFRFVSFVGERYTHGIIFDVLKKLKKNPKVLELLSDGTPKKSSVYVADGVEAIFKVIGSTRDRVNIFNIGHQDILTVDEIVDTILAAAGVEIRKKYLGGERGWKGDNSFVYLDGRKLKKLGWEQKYSFQEGIRKTVAYLKNNPDLLD
ncbi:MAG: NAD-dependent epimerase/dehydratase family protein [Candidatus Taylorbacteria bacterium]|nr:NAD-dependent epimerase/dehydratase family protein [Candidatus Taylorbacteria bacterium]